MRSPTGKPPLAAFMIRSLSSGPSSSPRNTGAVTSDSEFCREINDSRGLRRTLVLYAGARAGGCDVVSRIRISAATAGALSMAVSFEDASDWRAWRDQRAPAAFMLVTVKIAKRGCVSLPFCALALHQRAGCGIVPIKGLGRAKR